MRVGKFQRKNIRRLTMPQTGRLKNFTAHIPFTIEKKNYIVKTADSNAELSAALKLRHEVFLEELLNKKKRGGVDRDRFDKLCDHIIIYDKRNDMIVGTYRLQSSLHSKKWYTETEFHMKSISRLPGIKLELGRACVHPDHRNSITIALLWEGIKAYVDQSGANYLFGCSSVKTTDPNQIRVIYQYLRENGHLSHSMNIRPRSKYRLPLSKNQLLRSPVLTVDELKEQLKDRIPSLLVSYLKVGAKVYGNPAFDRDFQCIDFLTLLDTRNLRTERLRKPLS